MAASKSKTILSGVCDYKRADQVYLIDPEVITVQPGWNKRYDFTGHKELMESIRAIGVRDALVLKKLEDGTLALRKGERRLRAVMQLRSEGIEMRVPVIIKNSKVSDADLLFDDYVSNNTGRPFLPSEEAARFKQLIGYHFTPAEIASKTGKSEPHVRNMLSLADALPEVKKAADEGAVSSTAAIAVSKKPIEEQSNALIKAKSKPRYNKLVLSYGKDGTLRRGGVKDMECGVLEDLYHSHITRECLINLGFNPDTLRITVEKL